MPRWPGGPEGPAVNDAAPLQHPDYSERLWPSLGVWVLVPVVTGAVVVSLLPIGVVPAVVGAVVVAALLLTWAVMATPVVAVDAGQLVAGRARVPVSLLGDAVVARGADARTERGPRLDARAYLLIRGWIDPVVRVQLRDPADPTPYWLVSTRHPERLVQALEKARTARP